MYSFINFNQGHMAGGGAHGVPMGSHSLGVGPLREPLPGVGPLGEQGHSMGSPVQVMSNLGNMANPALMNGDGRVAGVGTLGGGGSGRPPDLAPGTARTSHVAQMPPGQQIKPPPPAPPMSGKLRL